MDPTTRTRALHGPPGSGGSRWRSLQGRRSHAAHGSVRSISVLRPVWPPFCRPQEAGVLHFAMFSGQTHVEIQNQARQTDSDKEQPQMKSTGAITEQTKRWSTRKKDNAPRGVFRHRSGVWAVRYTCGAGHIHQERVGPLKSDAVRAYHDRRARTLDEPGWCPTVQRRQERSRVLREQEWERARITLRDYGKQYLAWAESHHRSHETTRGQVEALIAAFGDHKLDEITTAECERFLAGLREGQSPSGRPLADATVNRYQIG